MRLLNKRGFTLLELVVVVAILSVTVLGLLASYIYCILLNEYNSSLVIAAGDAQKVLEEMKNLAYGSLQDYVDNFQADRFINLPGELVTFSGTDISGSIAEVVVNVDWTQRGASKNFSLSTRIAP